MILRALTVAVVLAAALPAAAQTAAGPVQPTAPIAINRNVFNGTLKGFLAPDEVILDLERCSASNGATKAVPVKGSSFLRQLRGRRQEDGPGRYQEQNRKHGRYEGGRWSPSHEHRSPGVSGRLTHRRQRIRARLSFAFGAGRLDKAILRGRGVR